jgi:hypothetical protein
MDDEKEDKEELPTSPEDTAEAAPASEDGDREAKEEPEEKSSESGAPPVDASAEDAPLEGVSDEFIDADRIIDLFLEEHPEYAEMPVEEWDAEALSALKDILDSEGLGEPDGDVPEETGDGALPGDALATPEEAAPLEVPEPPAEGAFETPSPAEAPEIASEPALEGALEVEAPGEGAGNDAEMEDLVRLVESGDKDGAWAALQNMLGVTADVQDAPTNQLDRIVNKSGGNALAKIIGGLKF